MGWGQGRVASRANSTSRGASMACALVAAPTWTGIWTKWNQQVRALGPAGGLDLHPIPRLPAEPGDGQSRAAGPVHDVGPPLGRRRVGARGQGERREVPVGPLSDDPGPPEA